MDTHTDQRARPTAPGKALFAGYAVEGGLGVVAVAIAWLAGIPLVQAIRPSIEALFWGLAATLPMLAMLAVLTRAPWRPIVRIRQIVRTFARQLLLRASWIEIAVLCVLAGVGEELLFRGVLQTLLAGWTNQVVGIVAAGVVFGAAHYLTTTYFLLAVGVGCYLGWLYVATNSLAAPIVAHAVYDFVALAIVLGNLRRDAPVGYSRQE